MKRSIKSSIGKKTFLSTLVLLMVCCTIIYGIVLYFLPKNYQTELESQFAAGFHKLIGTLEAEGIEDNMQTISDFSLQNNAVITIKDENGKEIIAVKASTNEEKSKDATVFNAISEFSYDGNKYTVDAVTAFIAVSQSYQVLIDLIPLAAIVIIFISLISALLYSRSFAKPLVNICSVAKRMAQLDMTWKCDTSRSDEIGVLASTLNDLSERLDHALNSLQEANEQLQEDIEKERRQEKQRIDFFTSVSHELKTPITVIKGELEGMIYQVGEYKDRDAYLRHSLKTVEEMEKLVKEILAAARMGGSDFQITPVSVNISHLIKQCCRKIQGIAEDKNIEMILELASDVCYQGDEKLLVKAFSNIINNAVVYSPEDAKVFVRLEGNTLTVENTGIHIAKDDLEQIFIPFYRIDKSRNRNTGGSGLGLYIAKTIFEHHGFFCSIENTSNGVKFIVHF